MLKKIVTLFVFILIVSSCNDNPMPKPDKLLGQDEMENILFDLAVLQAAETYRPINSSDARISSIEYIYKKYKIDSTIYLQNHRYYAADVKKFKKMYKHINNRLHDAKTEMDSAKNNNIQIIN